MSMISIFVSFYTFLHFSFIFESSLILVFSSFKPQLASLMRCFAIHLVFLLLNGGNSLFVSNYDFVFKSSYLSLFTTPTLLSISNAPASKRCRCSWNRFHSLQQSDHELSLFQLHSSTLVNYDKVECFFLLLFNLIGIQSLPTQLSFPFFFPPHFFYYKPTTQVIFIHL